MTKNLKILAFNFELVTDRSKRQYLSQAHTKIVIIAMNITTFISSYSYDIVYRILVCCPFDNCFVSKYVVQLISIIHHLLWKETSNPRETWWLWRMMTLNEKWWHLMNNDAFWWKNCDTPWWSISCLTDENGWLDKFPLYRVLDKIPLSQRC